MKKLIIAAVASAMIATPAVAAPNRADSNGHTVIRIDNTAVRDNDRRADNRPVANRQVTTRMVNTRQSNVRKANAQQNIRVVNVTRTHRWKNGDRFDRRYVTNYRVINNPRAYGLRNAPRGYRWVRSNNDAVLIGITSGIVASVFANSLR